MQLLVDINMVSSFLWSDALGSRLRSLREERGYTRKELSEKTAEIGKPVSMQYIQQLETPRFFVNKEKKTSELSVSKDVLMALCMAVDADITSVIDCAKIFLHSF